MNETAWYALENKVTASTEEERQAQQWKQILEAEIQRRKGLQH